MLFFIFYLTLPALSPVRAHFSTPEVSNILDMPLTFCPANLSSETTKV